jgi:hypothetical protein
MIRRGSGDGGAMHMMKAIIIMKAMNHSLLPASVMKMKSMAAIN